MAEALKYMYNPKFFDKICPILTTNIPNFDSRYFIYRVFDNAWPDLEFQSRTRKITQALRHFLPADFNEAAKILIKISKSFEANGIRGFRPLFLADYVQVYGVGYPEQAFYAIEEITKLFNTEFTIRPFITRYPQMTMKQMLKWSASDHANVRRLASESWRQMHFESIEIV